MAFPVPMAENDLVEIRVRGQLHGQTTITTFRYACDDPPTGPTMDLEIVASSFVGSILDPMTALTSEEMIYVSVEVQKIAPTRLIAYVRATTGTTGVVTGGSLPSGVAWVFRRKLLTAGRFAQGRIYMPGIPISSEDNSRIKAAVFGSTEVEDLEAGMLATITADAGQLRPALITPAPGGTWENRGFLFDIVPDPILRYQRRREVGVGQ